jgi:hypothetical protein
VLRDVLVSAAWRDDTGPAAPAAKVVVQWAVRRAYMITATPIRQMAVVR